MTKTLRIQNLISKLENLTDGQLLLIENILSEIELPFQFYANPSSDLINECVLQDFGDTLRIHHCFSREPFTKDKFEYALEKILVLCGVSAQLATRGNPGHDITINWQRFSLKTQADRSIKLHKIHISKFMELGRGTWDDSPEDLIGLRSQFFTHMDSYDRILTMRRLLPTESQLVQYELVEIPKDLLLLANNGTLEMRLESRQRPKPGYCFVKDEKGTELFQLYFDGGTERKLQIKNLDKSNCFVHATWSFESSSQSN